MQIVRSQRASGDSPTMTALHPRLTRDRRVCRPLAVTLLRTIDALLARKRDTVKFAHCLRCGCDRPCKTSRVHVDYLRHVCMKKVAQPHIAKAAGACATGAVHCSFLACLSVIEMHQQRAGSPG